MPEFSDEARNENEMAYAIHLHVCAVKAARMAYQSTELLNNLTRFAPDLREQATNFICNTKSLQRAN